MLFSWLNDTIECLLIFGCASLGFLSLCLRSEHILTHDLLLIPIGDSTQLIVSRSHGYAKDGQIQLLGLLWSRYGLCLCCVNCGNGRARPIDTGTANKHSTKPM